MLTRLCEKCGRRSDRARSGLKKTDKNVRRHRPGGARHGWTNRQLARIVNGQADVLDFSLCGGVGNEQRLQPEGGRQGRNELTARG